MERRLSWLLAFSPGKRISVSGWLLRTLFLFTGAMHAVRTLMFPIFPSSPRNTRRQVSTQNHKSRRMRRLRPRGREVRSTGYVFMFLPSWTPRCRIHYVTTQSIFTSGQAKQSSGPEPGFYLTGQLGISGMLSACVGKGQIQATRQPISYRNYHRRRFNTDMDDIRGSLSKFKKDIKHGFERIKRKGDKLGGGGREGTVGSPSSLPQPESRVSTGGSGGEQGGDGSDTDDENAGASGVDRPGWGSTASSSAKLVLRGVSELSDACGPLKSVAGGLCFILDNYEVRYLPSWVSVRLTCPQRTKANKQAIESLAPRVKELAELLCKPVRMGDVEEQQRRMRLER